MGLEDEEEDVPIRRVGMRDRLSFLVYEHYGGIRGWIKIGRGKGFSE